MVEILIQGGDTETAAREMRAAIKEIFEVLERDFHYAQVDKIRVEETMLNSFEYAGDREIRY